MRILKILSRRLLAALSCTRIPAAATLPQLPASKEQPISSFLSVARGSPVLSLVRRRARGRLLRLLTPTRDSSTVSSCRVKSVR